MAWSGETPDCTGETPVPHLETTGETPMPHQTFVTVFNHVTMSLRGRCFSAQ